MGKYENSSSTSCLPFPIPVMLAFVVIPIPIKRQEQVCIFSIYQHQTGLYFRFSYLKLLLLLLFVCFSIFLDWRWIYWFGCKLILYGYIPFLPQPHYLVSKEWWNGNFFFPFRSENLRNMYVGNLPIQSENLRNTYVYSDYSGTYLCILHSQSLFSPYDIQVRFKYHCTFCIRVLHFPSIILLIKNTAVLDLAVWKR